MFWQGLILWYDNYGLWPWQAKPRPTSVLILERDIFTLCYLKYINLCISQTLTCTTDRMKRMKTSSENTGNDNACTVHRCLDKRGGVMISWDNFSYFSMKPYVVTPQLNCLVKMVQMRGHNICFYAELTKIISMQN